MQRFTDTSGASWALEATVTSLRRVLKLTGTDLTELDAGDPPLCVRLETNVMLLVDVLYALLEPDATAAGLSDVQFGEQLGPEGLKAGKEALSRELTDFFRRLGRQDQLKVLEAQATFLSAASARKLSRLEKIDPDALLNALEEQANAKIDQEFPGLSAKLFGSKSTTAPPCSASTPVPTVSGGSPPCPSPEIPPNGIASPT